jgi:hypothetical protein
MPSTVAPRVRLGALLALLLLLVLTACGGGDGSPTVAPDSSVATTVGGTGSTAPAGSATVLAVTVRGGSVVDGAARQRATVNQPVTVRVTSDVADSVHVHGYNKMFDVAPGRAAEVTFVANIPGVFEVEFEKSGKLLFTMEVR